MAGGRQSAQPGQPVNRAQASQSGQPMNRAQAPQSGQPVNRAQASQAGQPVNRAQASQAGQPVNRAQASQPRQPVNRAQASQPRQPVNRAQPSQILPGVRPGLELKKGQKASLTQKNPNLMEIDVCMGWKVQNPMCDLDASAFLLGADNKVIGEDWFVFYGQTASPDGSVVHCGDNRNGTGSGDAETLNIKLRRLNPKVKKIVFITVSYTHLTLPTNSLV